jgi:hypothetical protein
VPQLSRSPLIMGGELPTLDASALSLLTNPEVIAVNQNSSAGHESFRTGTFVVWAADVPDGSGQYVAVFNISDVRQILQVNWDTIGVNISKPLVHDLWERRDVGALDGLSLELQPHASALYLVKQVHAAQGLR